MGKDLKGKKLGTGISQRKDGLYVARYTDRFGRRQSPMYAKTEREIKKKYRDAKYEDEHNIAARGARVTLDQWYETWLETYAPESLKQHTIFGYMNSYKNHIRPVFGHMIIQDITPLMIKQWATKIRDAGAKSAQNYLVAFKSILRDAQVAGLIQSNPAGNVSIRSNYVSQKTIALTQKQLELFFENFKCNPNKAGTDWLLVMKFLVLTGYRFGEMASLRWSDIDWENQCMYVCAADTAYEIR